MRGPLGPRSREPLRSRCSGLGSPCESLRVATIFAPPGPVTFLAESLPLSPWATSNSTSWPSARLRKPSAWIADWCTNTSLPPSLGVMKPKPLSCLNHNTLPVCLPEFINIILCFRISLLLDSRSRARRACAIEDPHAARSQPSFSTLSIIPTPAGASESQFGSESELFKKSTKGHILSMNQIINMHSSLTYLFTPQRYQQDTVLMSFGLGRYALSLS